MAKPVVDGLESNLEGRATVIRLDVMSRVGRQAAARYRVRGVPTLVVIDRHGQAVYSQAGIPRSGPVLEHVESILSIQP